MWMLDTNICIYVIKRKPERVFERLRKLDPSDVCVSSITLAELEYGVTRSSRPAQNAEALTALLAPLGVAPFDERAAAAYGGVRARLERAGTLIGSLDMLIAAHALSLGRVLVTHNLREFERVDGLHAESWV